MTAKKYNMRYYKCHSGCNFVTSNKTCFKKHYDSVTHLINNRIKNKNACKRCIDGEEYDAQHLNYHELVNEDADMEQFIDILINDRIEKDNTVDEEQLALANEFDIDMFSW